MTEADHRLQHSFAVSRKSSQAAAIAIRGPVVVSNSHRLREHVVDLLSEGVRDVVLDCRACGYADASGLSALLRCEKLVEKAGARITLANVGADLKALLALTKLDTILTLAAESEAA